MQQPFYEYYYSNNNKNYTSLVNVIYILFDNTTQFSNITKTYA